VKKVTLLTVGVSCLLAGVAVPVRAQSAMLKSEVPFAFVSSGRTIQAGQYSIDIRQTQVRFIDANGHQVQVVLSNPQQESRLWLQPRLVFHRYGEAYFLSQIWTTDHTLDFRMSRAEYNLKASLKADQETITLAMR
jgi:hypothetical protein